MPVPPAPPTRPASRPDVPRSIERASVELAVRHALGDAGVRVADWTAEPVPYPIRTPSTAALERLDVRLVDGRTVRLFVKTLQSLALSPMLEFIPPPHREAAIAGFPWRVEADVFAQVTLSPPDGLRPPHVHLIEGPDDERARLWTEFVDHRPTNWDLSAYATAARGLGGFAARHRDGRVTGEPTKRAAVLANNFHGRIARFVLPQLHDPNLWRHPLVAEAADDRLRDDLAALEADAPAILGTLDRLPRVRSHGRLPTEPPRAGIGAGRARGRRLGVREPPADRRGPRPATGRAGGERRARSIRDGGRGRCHRARLHRRVSTTKE